MIFINVKLPSWGPQLDFVPTRLDLVGPGWTADDVSSLGKNRRSQDAYGFVMSQKKKDHSTKMGDQIKSRFLFFKNSEKNWMKCHSFS